MSNQKPLLKMNFHLTREQIESRREESRETGFYIIGDKGTVTYKGATLDYQYEDGILTVSLIKKEGLSRFRSVEYIREQLEKILEV